jgi:hypothetical protein
MMPAMMPYAMLVVRKFIVRTYDYYLKEFNRTHLYVRGITIIVRNAGTASPT